MSSVPVSRLSPPLETEHRGREAGRVAPEGSPPSLLSLDTIGKLIEHPCEVTLWCRNCKSVGDGDLDRVAAERGRDWMFVGQRWPVACAECGSEHVQVQIAHKQN